MFEQFLKAGDYQFIKRRHNINPEELDENGDEEEFKFKTKRQNEGEEESDNKEEGF